MRFWSWAQFRLGVSLVYPTADDVGLNGVGSPTISRRAPRSAYLLLGSFFPNFRERFLAGAVDASGGHRLAIRVDAVASGLEDLPF
jgi:hypothetical protein